MFPFTVSWHWWHWVIRDLNITQSSGMVKRPHDFSLFQFFLHFYLLLMFFNHHLCVRKVLIPGLISYSSNQTISSLSFIFYNYVFKYCPLNCTFLLTGSFSHHLGFFYWTSFLAVLHQTGRVAVDHFIVCLHAVTIKSESDSDCAC